MGATDRAYYAASIPAFRAAEPTRVLDALAGRSSAAGFAPREAQLAAWQEQIRHLQAALAGHDGAILLEYSIPRMGRRIDAVLLLGPVVFVVEFKVGERCFDRPAVDQVWDYALDLKNFHEASHEPLIAPILVATAAPDPAPQALVSRSGDRLLDPLRANPRTFPALLRSVLATAAGPAIRPEAWHAGRYRPTPTIIEAAMALYGQHSVADIARNDASATNLAHTSGTVTGIIRSARTHGHKAICFVTGVPGAGKTLVGLDVATRHMDRANALHSVYLSGNGPLVKILTEALARDHVARAEDQGQNLRIGAARSQVKAFIQNVHHFRDEALRDPGPPVEHVAIFDEAQRAWTRHKAGDWMRRKKGVEDFDQSEPEFLISCLDRHPDWAVVVCLVGGGQEINVGEAGIGEWMDALHRRYPRWQIHLSPRLTDSEYGAGQHLQRLEGRPGVHRRPELHLATSMRSFRAENVSQLVKFVLDVEPDAARASLAAAPRYPIVLTRDLAAAKRWLRTRARGTERYGLVASSQAQRLKPHAITVKAPLDPVHWFLDDKEDVRSSYYLEDAATEFHVQGLELDWTCVTWDADLRHDGKGWAYWAFKGKRWTRIRQAERQQYLKNAYRVLLTRARQGMVIVVPEGDTEDPTRDPTYYDPTYEYLRGVGFPAV